VAGFGGPLKTLNREKGSTVAKKVPVVKINDSAVAAELAGLARKQPWR
jgi:hypothetical protein